jgi:hypothetical protein
MAESRVTVTVQDDLTFDSFQIVGSSDSAAEAKAEAQAKVAATVGVTVLSVSESTAGTVGDYPISGGTEGRDAQLTLRKGTDKSTTRSIPIRLLDTATVNATAQDGSIDVDHALITAIGDAYRDSSGTGGYTVIRGAFVD